MRTAFVGYEAHVNHHFQHRLLALAAALSIGSMGCDAPDQPADPSSSTLQQPSISDVPEGNMVPPVQPAEPEGPNTSGG